MKAKRMVTVAMLIAMYVVLSLFSINLGNMKITLGQSAHYCWSSFTWPTGRLSYWIFRQLFESAIDIWFNANHHSLGDPSCCPWVIDRALCKTLSF